jgi:chromosome partitioning protein
LVSRVLAIVNIKGGVGKTTTAANLAAALVERGHRILAVDLDPQAALTFSLGIPTEGLNASIGDVLAIRGINLASTVQSTSEHIDLVPASQALDQVAQRLENNHVAVTLLRAALEPLRDRYDYILVDCPPNAGILMGQALAAADEIVVPLVPDALSVEALQRLLFIVEQVRETANPTLRVAGLLLTMYDPQKRHAREIIQMVNRLYGSQISFYNAVVKSSDRFDQAASAGKSILAFESDSQAAMAYRVLAGEIENGIREMPASELNSVLERGTAALEQKDLKTAFAAFCRATELDPKLARAWIGRAESAPSWNEGVRSLAQALVLEPELRTVRAQLEERLKVKSIVSMPSDIVELIPLADYLEEIGLTAYAERLYRRVIELDRRNERAWLGRARTEPSDRDAVVLLQRYLEINPDSAQAKTALNVRRDRLKAGSPQPPQISAENDQAGAVQSNRSVWR